MWKNYLRTALRSLQKRRLYSVINIGGLTIGTACCLLILLLVRHEWSYDDFHENADRIYRTYIEYVGPDGQVNYQNLMFPEFTPLLADRFAAVERATRFVQSHLDLQRGNDVYRQRLAEVDPGFFQIFTFSMLAGDPSTALADPSGMVITEDAAQTFFGQQEGPYDEVLGKTISIPHRDQTYTFTVTGVAASPPATSSLQFDVVISFENYDEIQIGNNRWGGRTATYLLLQRGQDPYALENTLASFVETQFAGYRKRLRNNNRLAEGDEAFRMFLQPLSDVHLSPDIGVPYGQPPHNPLYSYILAGIGVLVLLIACINFTTLSVGRSTERAKEVGVRKSLGATPRQLAWQFWGETLMLTALSLLLGLVVTSAALPFFNDVTGQSLSLATFRWHELALSLAALLLIVGVVAGGYPALLLSRFQPAAVLQGEIPGKKRGWFTRGLVVLQYTVSIGLIAATIVMSEQIQYLLHKDLGYEEDLVMVVHTDQVARDRAPGVLNYFRNELLPYDQVTHVERTGNPFLRRTDRNTWKDASGTTRSAYNFGVGVDYVDLMGMEIVAGRDFSHQFPSDSTRGVLVNEALVREFGLEDPVGTKMTNWLSNIYEEPPTVIGVVEDFHFQSLREEVEPAVLNMHPDYYNYMGAILVRMKPDRMQETIQQVKATWSDVLPGKPFSYSFLDEDLAQQYQSEERWSTIVTSSAALALLIACLGLFGLATLSVTGRTREIGIRKALGASAASIAALFSRDFVQLVLIAAVLAAPLAFYAMQRWLDNFAYRIDMPWWVFPVAGLGAVLVALLTVSIQAVKAAHLDPAQVLHGK